MDSKKNNRKNESFLEYVRIKEEKRARDFYHALGWASNRWYQHVKRGWEIPRRDYAKIANLLDISYAKFLEYDREFFASINDETSDSPDD